MKKRKKYIGWILTFWVSFSSLIDNHVEATDILDDATKTLSTDITLYYSNQTYINSAQKINITTPVDAKTAPLQGFGIYGNNNNFDYRGKELIIKTTGSTADAVQINTGTSTVYFGDSLKVTTTGSSADGINVTENSNSGMGVRVNNSITDNKINMIQVGDNLVILTNGSGNNSLDGVGYGVYAGLRAWKTSSQKADSRLIIGSNSEIETQGKTAHAVYANNLGKIVLGNKANITVGGDNANALRAEALVGKVGDITTTLLGDTTIRAKSVGKSGQYAMYVKGNSTTNAIISNVETDQTLETFRNKDFLGNTISISSNQRAFNVIGNFFADSNGLINLDMTDGTEIVGSSAVASTGEINFKIDGAHSFWRLTDGSTLTNMTLTSGATIYLSDETDLLKRQKLTINGNFQGQDGKLVFNGVLDGDASPIDKVIIKGNATGSTKVAVNN